MARKPPREAEDRLVRWSRSMVPGTVGGRIAAAQPLAVDLSGLSARMRVSPGAPTGGDGTAWQQDDFTSLVTGTPPPSTYTLTNQPISQSERVYIRGLRQRPGTDYTLVGQVVTFASGLLVAGDSLYADYEYLSSVPAAPTAGPGTTSDYWQILSNTARLTSLGAGSGQIDTFYVDTVSAHNDVTAVINAAPTTELNVMAAFVPGNGGPTGTWARCCAQIYAGQIKPLAGGGGTSDVTGAAVTCTTYPCTVRVKYDSTGTLTVWLNGALVSTRGLTSAQMAIFDASRNIGVGMQSGAATPVDSISSVSGVTDSFNRADRTGLGSADSGHVWEYDP